MGKPGHSNRVRGHTAAAIDPLREIEALVRHAPRGPGSDGERRAARHLAARLRAIGRDAQTEPFDMWPRWPLAHLLHAVAAIVGSLVSVSSPLAGGIVLAVVAVLVFGDLTGIFQPTRHLTGRRASQNVVSREDGDRPGTIVLVAHYDAARSGVVFNDRSMRRRAWIGRLIHRPIGPFEPFFWAIALALACAGLRFAGVHTSAVTAVQFAATVVLIVSVPLLADIALSDVVPGANDNASGVATALRLADRYGDSLDHFDVWVVLTGSEEAFARGARAFVRRHRRELDRSRTVFLCVDKVGAGTVRYARREGLLVARSYHSMLVGLCDQIAAEDAEDDDRYGARSIVSRSVTDAVPARGAGYPAVSIACLGARGYAPHYHQPTDVPANLEPEALERAFGFCSELIELLDEEIGPELL
ncbi:MAG: hypothetical protein QOE06_2440 [Thermoleophilaceae bacterium]|nr:hypothetical protein [Thermoleophilaceae bacterium]